MLSTFYQQHKLACVTALYLLVLSLPSLFIASDGFNKAIYGALIILAVLNNARWFFWLLLPFFALSHVALYYAIFYQLPTDVSFWFLLFGSSLNEVMDFIARANKLFIILSYSLYIAVGIFCYQRMQGQFFSNPKSWWRIALIALVLYRMPLEIAMRVIMP